MLFLRLIPTFGAKKENVEEEEEEEADHLPIKKHSKLRFLSIQLIFSIVDWFLLIPFVIVWLMRWRWNSFLKSSQKVLFQENKLEPITFIENIYLNTNFEVCFIVLEKRILICLLRKK